MLYCPQSVHQWRQADCASMALNYYQSDMNFFKPEMHAIISKDGTNGKNVSECPIIPFTVAILYKIFGYHDCIYRVVTAILFYIGMFFLYALFNLVLKDKLWALIITLLLFSSPILAFYGNNFISNSPAFTFAIVGWYYFLRYYNSNRKRCFIFSMLMFAIAGLLKIIALISFFSIVGLYLMEHLNLLKFRKNSRIFNKKRGFYLLTFLAVVLIQTGWYYYAIYYNNSNNAYYFGTNIWPLWEASTEKIANIFNTFRSLWLKDIYAPILLYFLGIIIIFNLFYLKQSKRYLNYSYLFIITFTIAYLVLWFQVFNHHDYYLINTFILPVFIFLQFFIILKKRFNRIFRSIFSKIPFMVLAIYVMIYANHKLYGRYNGWQNDFPDYKALTTIKPFLRENGIKQKDKIICMPDNSPNYSLYLVNRKGWTDFGVSSDRDGILYPLSHGAKFLIIMKSELFNREYIFPFLKKKIGEYENFLIYKINYNNKNEIAENQIFHDDRIHFTKIICDAEQLSPSGKEFLSNDQKYILANGKTRTQEQSRSGQSAVKLKKGREYGFTLILQNIHIGDIVKASVWKKDKPKTGYLVISNPDNIKNLYISEKKTGTMNDKGWELVEIIIEIPSNYTSDKLGLYVYNPEEVPVYFDDFEILLLRQGN